MQAGCATRSGLIESTLLNPGVILGASLVCAYMHVLHTSGAWRLFAAVLSGTSCDDGLEMEQSSRVAKECAV